MADKKRRFVADSSEWARGFGAQGGGLVAHWDAPFHEETPLLELDERAYRIILFNYAALKLL